MRDYVLSSTIAYLCGSIPFGYLLVRLFKGKDIRDSGSGNIGATNVARMAPGLGLATLLLDAGKGIAAVLIALHWAHPFSKDIVFCGRWADFGCSWPKQYATSLYLGPALAALLAIAGHMFPVWLKFRGGKGVATGVGAFGALAPHALLASLLTFVLLVAAFRYVSLGSILSAAAFPVFIWIFNRPLSASPGSAGLRLNPPPSIFTIIVLSSALIIAKHHANIQRLLNGTENRFGKKKVEQQIVAED